MTIEPKPAKRAKKPSVPSAPNKPGAPLVPLHREDPVAFGAWLGRMRDQIDDAIAVAYDATSRAADRRLSRAYARQLLEEAEDSLMELLDMAQPPDQD